MPQLMSVAWPKSLGSRAVNQKALDNIGVGTKFNRAPFWSPEVQATKENPLSEKVKQVCLHLSSLSSLSFSSFMSCTASLPEANMPLLSASSNL